MKSSDDPASTFSADFVRDTEIISSWAYEDAEISDKISFVD